MTTHQDMLFHLGGLPIMSGIPFTQDSQYFFVDAVHGSDSNAGKSPDKALATLIAAEDKCVASNHDTIFLLGLGTPVTHTAAITWDKSYTHLIGIAAPTGVAVRARMENIATTGLTPLLDITATGCIFKNWYQFQGVDEAVGNINVQVTGGRNYFEGVHFAGGGHATQAIDGGASLLLNGAEENLFVNCTVGLDTIAAATGMMGMRVDGSSRRNKFRGCLFTMAGGNAAAGFVELVDISAIDRYLLFDDCKFINNGTNFNSAFVVPAGFDPTNMRILLHDCSLFGADDWEDQDRGAISANMGTITAGGNAGLFEDVAAT